MIAKWMQISRQNRGWSQADLADFLGITVSAVRHWEAGRHSPNSQHIARLHEVFDEDVQTFGAWLKGALRARGSSQRALARELGVPKSTVNAWATTRRRPSPAYCEKLAQALALPLDEVLRRAGHGTIDPLLLPVAPPVLAGGSRSCTAACRFYDPCGRDVMDGLPAFCEAPDGNDVLLAERRGMLERIWSRYATATTTAVPLFTAGSGE